MKVIAAFDALVQAGVIGAPDGLLPNEAMLGRIGGVVKAVSQRQLVEVEAHVQRPLARHPAAALGPSAVHAALFAEWGASSHPA